MRILLVSQWYKPVKSPVKRMVRIAEFLAKNNDVTVLTSLPSYPTGILPQKYRGKLWDKSTENAVKIIRVWDFPTPNRGFIKRTINHLVFVFSSIFAITFMQPYDTVIVSSPSFFSGLAGLYAAKIGGGKFIFDVRDLWPDSAFELGYQPRVFIKKILKRLEKYYYQKAQKIFCATSEINRTISKMGIPKEKLATLVNTVDITLFRPVRIKKEKFGFKKNDFVVIYVGSLTQVQNLNTIIDAAKLLEKNENIKILIVGEGEDKENLINYAQKKHSSNIIFKDGQPTENVVELINVADIGLISLSKNKFFSDNALPTKTSEYLGCGKPIIACAGTNLKELIEKNQVGDVVSPGASQMLAKKIVYLFENKKILKNYSRNARRLTVKHFSDRKFYQVLQRNLF